MTTIANAGSAPGAARAALPPTAHLLTALPLTATGAAA